MPVERLRAARPEFLIDGNVDAGLGAGLASLLVEETGEGLYRCEAVFGNWGPGSGGGMDFLYFDRSLLDFGKALTVRVGDATLFRGRIGGIEGRFPPNSPPQIAILAEDRLQDLRMTRHSRSFENMSDADVFNRIAQEHGLTADVDLPGGAHPVLAQVNQSDLAFLRERARATGVELWVDDRTLKAKPRGGRGGSRLTLNYGGRLRQFTVLADLAHQATGVTVGAWDVGGKQAIAGEADTSTVGAELDGGDSGGDVLQQAFGARALRLAHCVPASEDEARRTAEAWFRRLARRFVVGRGVAEYEAGLAVGAQLRLEGLGALFSGTYVVSEVRHRFDGRQGLWSEFTGERAGLGGGR